MRVFLVSLCAYVVLAGLTGVAYVAASASATEAYSMESARVGQVNPVDGRLGWRAEDY